jgi:plasmid stabilization system protein ParE
MFRVITIPKADADISEIFEYLYARSPNGATAWLAAFDQAQQRLAMHADGCALAEEREYFEVDLRQTLFRTRRGNSYRILFTIVGDEVRILRVRSPGQSDLTEHDL